MSPIPKYAAKRDGNETEIVRALKALPCVRQAQCLSQPGVPDLLVCVTCADGNGALAVNRWLFVEVKEPGKKLTPEQAAWWQRCAGPGVVVQTPMEAGSAAGAFSEGRSLDEWSWTWFAPKGTPVPAKQNTVLERVLGLRSSLVPSATQKRRSRGAAHECRCGHVKEEHDTAGCCANEGACPCLKWRARR